MASKIETATMWMINKANDPHTGYDQIHRWGPNYDCSSATISAWQYAGVPVKTKGATYTANIRPVFLACGFKDVTNTVNFKTGAGLQRGDVLLNAIHHVAMYIGNGQEVEASINEFGRATGGKTGDQTGKEFLIRSYRNYPWQYCLRYNEGQSISPASTSQSGTSLSILRMGSRGNAVVLMQQMLAICGYNIGSSGADGVFGTDTYNALIKFQKEHGLIADGEYGSQSKATLTTVYKKKYEENLTALAKEVINGKWGYGDDRKSKLEKAGYNYQEVQNKVNQLLK